MAGNDTVAFREFVVARSPQLLRSAYLLTGDRSCAEDLVQDALLKTYLAWDKVTGADDAFAYTQRILYTTSSRMHRRRRVAEEFGTVPEEVGAESAQYLQHPGDIGTRDDLGQALLALPRKQRAVLVLRFYEDLRIEKVAEIMGCSIGTVKSQTSKALAKLRNSSVLEPRNARRP